MKFLNVYKEGEACRERVFDLYEKAFYLRNGLKETGLYARVYGTDFELPQQKD